MPNLVTAGATLKCTLGSAASLLQIPAAGITAGTVPVATTAHNTPMTNIRPFGLCTAQANPAAGPNKPPPPCVPAGVAPWTPGSPTVRAGNIPVLTHTCQCHCQWGGVISIVAAGQQTTTAAG